jgi:hypothetical protein
MSRSATARDRDTRLSGPARLRARTHPAARRGAACASNSSAQRRGDQRCQSTRWPRTPELRPKTALHEIKASPKIRRSSVETKPIRQSSRRYIRLQARATHSDKVEPEEKMKTCPHGIAKQCPESGASEPTARSSDVQSIYREQRDTHPACHLYHARKLA